MKKLLFAVIILFACCGCEKDDNEPATQKLQISFITNKQVGETIALKFREGMCPTEVIGATKCSEEALPEMDGGGVDMFNYDAVLVTYTLTSQNVIIKGDIKHLGCDENELRLLDVTKNAALETLYCSDNELTAMDLSKNVALKNLNCYGNKLTALDLSKCVVLESLNCGNNKLTALDVSKNTELEEICCHINQLTSLNLSKNNKLQYLMCYINEIKADNMSKLLHSLRDRTGETFDWWNYYRDGKLYLVVTSPDEGNELNEADRQIATDKNWEIYKQ